MRSSAAWWALALVGVAGGAALAACATGADTIPTPIRGSGSSSSGSSGGSMDDATVSTSSSSSGSSGGYGDDSTNPTPPGPDTGAPGDDGGGNVPGPTCLAGQACVDGIPSGWSGFVQVLLQAGDAGAGCAAPYATPQPQLGGQTNPDGGPATCGACSCFVPDAGATCSVKLGTSNLLCLPPTGGPSSPATQNTCVSGLTLPSGEVSAPTATGACQAAPVPTTAPPPPPSSTTAVACALPDGGAAADAAAGTTCASGQACADVPAGVDGGAPSGACIYAPGVQDCPSGTVFTTQHVVGALEDDRGCGCTCGSFTCPGDGYVAGYSNANCTGTPSLIIDAGTPCKGSLSQTSFKYFPSHGPSNGTCAPIVDAGPTGSVVIDGGTATTFCCVP